MTYKLSWTSSSSMTRLWFAFSAGKGILAKHPKKNTLLVCARKNCLRRKRMQEKKPRKGNQKKTSPAVLREARRSSRGFRRRSSRGLRRSSNRGLRRRSSSRGLRRRSSSRGLRSRSSSSGHNKC